MIDYILYFVVAIVILHSYYLRKNCKRIIEEICGVYINKQEELTEIVAENEKLMETFENHAKNKIYELSLIFLSIKVHYEKILEITDITVNPEYYMELRKAIEQVEEELKEIGFLTNKKRTCTSLIKELDFSPNSNFSKN